MCTSSFLPSPSRLSGSIVSPADIQANLQYILNDNTPRPDTPVGYLTAENRDVWANVRTKIVDTSENNAQVMKMIDSAVFCLCLDETSPDGPEDMTRNMLYGDAAYRWVPHWCRLIINQMIITFFLTEKRKILKVMPSLCCMLFVYCPPPPQKIQWIIVITNSLRPLWLSLFIKT